MANNYTAIENMILGCLSYGPKTGYEIKSIIMMSTSWFYNASYGSIYPILKKHETNGLVTSEEVVDNGRYKRIYQLTPAGQVALKEWMLEAPHLMTVKYEMWSLFFFKILQPEQRIQQVEQHIDQLLLFRQELQEVETVADEKADPFQRLILDWGEDLYTFLIKWYQELLNKLRTGEYDENQNN
jgi:DNA-binding PadR family transcriptional regulator